MHQSVIHHGEQSRRTSGRVDRLRDGHETGSTSTGQRTTEILDVVEVVAQLEQLCDGDASKGRDELSSNGISRLRERDFNGIEFQYGSRALINELVFVSVKRNLSRLV